MQSISLNEAEIFDGTPPEDFNLPKLRELLNQKLAIDFEPEIFKDKDYSDIREILYKYARGVICRVRVGPLSKEQRSEIQRAPILTGAQTLHMERASI